MLIHEMAREASIELLARVRLGRLACANQGQPYITPIYYAYDHNYLYSFSTLGQKIAWMRANPLVCVEADELVSPQYWATVIVFGKYEELPDTPECEADRRRAYELLQRRPLWWEPAFAKTVPEENTRPMEPMYFRTHIDRISGHRGIPDTASSGEFCTTHERTAGWLERILGYGKNTLP
jgi:nitroimidazol reductase NimA-like FMN-containing flavoprotein (pyridoxamine 5'-phosphate oxidase superfamily)